MVDKRESQSHRKTVLTRHKSKNLANQKKWRIQKHLKKIG
jgi:hypothetical protein